MSRCPRCLRCLRSLQELHLYLAGLDEEARRNAAGEILRLAPRDVDLAFDAYRCGYMQASIEDVSRELACHAALCEVRS